MFIRCVSDLHQGVELLTSAKKISERLIPPLETDPLTVLIIAGDLGPVSKADRNAAFLEQLLNRFKHVIYVFGNHEHYGSHLDQSMSLMVAALEKRGVDETRLTMAANVPHRITIDGVTFLLGTLWTDYGATKPNVEKIEDTISLYINDHRHIKTDTGNAGPDVLRSIFDGTVNQFAAWMTGEDNSRTVVVTHHMPTFKAVDPQFMQDDVSLMLNHAFTSDLDSFIAKHQPAYWFFGHTHTPFVGEIGTTKLYCNPHGYQMEGNFPSKRFKTDDVLEV